MTDESTQTGQSAERDPELAPHQTSSVAERRASRYLLGLLIVLLVLWVFPFVAERWTRLQPYSVSQFGSLLDYSYGLSGENADVVIFGDSSAMNDVDAVKLSAMLQRNVVILPNTSHTLPITGTLALRWYLQHNRAPGLIVFFFSRPDLNFPANRQDHLNDGEEQLVRHAGFSEMAHFFSRHPKELALFPLRFYRASNRLMSALTLHAAPEQLGSRLVRGHLDYPGHVVLRDNCVLPAALYQSSKVDTIQKLLRGFASENTRTMAYLAPVPDCAHAQEAVAMPLENGQVLNAAVLPHGVFADDGGFAHVMPESTGVTTEALARVIEEYEASAGR